MTLREETAADVSRRVGCLREEYGDDFEVRAETVENDPEFFEHGRTLAEEGWRGDAGAWVTDGAEQVLLIRHADAPEAWTIPGGGHEPGETHAETARREVREETGVECEITDVWKARRKEIVLETDPDKRFSMLTVWFEARARGTDVSVGDEGILEARWFADAPEAVQDFLEPKFRAWADV
jgi:ADP-ribose pyrophosphatase YjhB (NUDIX family)